MEYVKKNGGNVLKWWRPDAKRNLKIANGTCCNFPPGFAGVSRARYPWLDQNTIGRHLRQGNGSGISFPDIGPRCPGRVWRRSFRQA